MKHWTKPYLFGFVSKYNIVYEVSRRIIQQITLGSNKQLPNGDPNFIAGQGWLNMWKKRRGIRHLTVTGVSLSGERNASGKIKKDFYDIIKNKI